MFGISYTAPKAASAEDISGHWAYTEMNYLINEEIMKGDDTGSYRLNDSVNRAEFATFLVRALELPGVDTTSTFNDVKAGDWYYDAVNQASYYELIKGDDKGNFKPNDKITRQEMAAMMKRALDQLGIESSAGTISFNDNAQIANWAYDDVQRVVSAELMSGKPGNLFAPKAQASRAEAGVVLYRLLGLETDPGNELEPEEPGIEPEPEEPTTEPEVPGTEEPGTEEPGTEEPEEPVTSLEPIYETSNYPVDFSHVLNLQANHRPNQDGGGVFIATPAFVAYHLNSNNFAVNSPEYYQFLKLSKPVQGLDANEINQKELSDKYILKGTAASFIEAGLTHEINAIYLIAHALHETNLGRSKLANGIEVGLNAEGKPEMVTDENRESLSNIKLTYNFYGIGAINKDPNKYGSERAYSEGWFTIHDAIVGGAKFVREKYIDEGQDTLYKMKWDPDQPTNHQYATHVQWAIIQARKIHDIYAKTGSDKTTQLVFDVPQYRNQPATSPLPAPEAQYAVLPALQGGVGYINSTDGDVRLRSYPAIINTNIITQLPHGTKISVVGSNGNWYRVVANGKEGWVRNDYTKLTNLLKVVDLSAYAVKVVNLRSEPNTSSTSLTTVAHNTVLAVVVDGDGNLVKDGDWYQVIANGKTGWIRGDLLEELKK